MLDNINKKLTLPILVALYWQYFHGGQFLLFKKKQKNQPQKPAPHPQKFKLLLDL